MIKKLTLTAALASTLLTGCATQQPGIVQVGPWQAAPGRIAGNTYPYSAVVQDPVAFVGDTIESQVGAVFTQPLDNPFIAASQVNQVLQGVMGPNNVSAKILDGMNYYRTGAAVLNNPWLLLSMIKN
jgi:hypothetical protein